MVEPRFLTWQEILDRQLSFLPPQWRANFTGKILQRLMVAFALVMEGLYGLLAQVLRLSVVSTSEGQYLRDLVRGWGMRSFDGVSAIAMVQFRRYRITDDPVPIPAGTEVRTQDGQRFRVMLGATIWAGADRAIAPAVCTRAGVVGNVGPGRIIALATPLDGVDEVTNPDGATGGIDTEPDGDLRARVPLHLATLHRATIPATTAAIAANRRDYPEVLTFVTEQRAGIPGYLRGILGDSSGGDVYRASGGWRAADGLSGVWWRPLTLPPESLQGLVMADWPCKRFGEVGRDGAGREVWGPSLSAAAVAAGDYRWYLDGAGRLYAKADGRDLNGLPITLVAGVVARALADLENNWVAAGVGVDVLVPFLAGTAIALTYALDPGYTEDTVTQSLANAVAGHLGTLRMGDPLTLDGLYGALAGVPGAGFVEIAQPTATVTPTRTEIVRATDLSISRRS